MRMVLVQPIPRPEFRDVSSTAIDLFICHRRPTAGLSCSRFSLYLPSLNWEPPVDPPPTVKGGEPEMTGGSTSFPPSSSHGKKDKSRWVGRAAILKQYPRCSEWMRLLALTISFLGVQLVWSCQMAQGVSCSRFR